MRNVEQILLKGSISNKKGEMESASIRIFQKLAAIKTLKCYVPLFPQFQA
jgi:hypothetical protein